MVVWDLLLLFLVLFRSVLSSDRLKRLGCLCVLHPPRDWLGREDRFPNDPIILMTHNMSMDVPYWIIQFGLELAFAS